MLKRFIKIIGGDPNKREIDKYSEIVEQINALESQFELLSDEALSKKTAEFRQRLHEGETLDDMIVEAFAAVREASKRTIGLRHYDVQLIGGVCLHQGKIAEMRTGEGKTLVATLPLYLNALTNRGVHLITVNDYLARRDARWMGPIYHLLGLKIGVLQMAARTENGKKAFLYDPDRDSPHEDQDQLRMVPRQEAYAADITYGTNSEFGFDHLRDNMTMSLVERVQRGFYYAIVDEVDNVLIDEARTPLIISGPAQDEAEWYYHMAQVVKKLLPEDLEVNEKDHTVTLTEMGEGHVEALLGVALRDPDRPEDLTHEQARTMGYLEQALRAQFLYKRNKDYLVQAGKVIIIDEFTGRLMPGRRWSDGLHQAVEAKEGVKVQSESVTYATITIQNYFRMYEKLAGMTGTAVTEAEEFHKIYNLDVLAIPTNLEYQAVSPDSELVEMDGRDEQGYKYNFYTLKTDTQKLPVFWKRKDYPDVVYRTEEAKLRSIVTEILRFHAMGRPMLVGTTSVELSERLSSRLRAEPLRRIAQILFIRNAWIEKNHREEDGRLIPELEFLNKPLDKLEDSEIRKLARELGISSNPEDPSNVERLIHILNIPSDYRERLVNDLKAGIPHQVLNARKHTEESQIIAGAGAYGAVTIATNMAGRGVDIKLGGELAEEVLIGVNRILSRAGYRDPYDMTMQERYKILSSLDPSSFGIYDAEINYFFQHIKEMELVRNLGGLHVIGSERHEARRIDNQLRGRAARQGDPGSSRFYLSMEDELMRLFGGQQADGLMQRLKIDDAMPLEVGLVSRLVEQSQTRVEGANFDVRKHLLEYDDVLNAQRTKIYAQRDRIFTKDDLKEDVTEMLRTEIMQRIPVALQDEGGPWRLIAWLDQIQPPISINGLIFPSYSLKLLVNDFIERLPAQVNRQELMGLLLDVAENAIQSEKQHTIQAVTLLLDQTRDKYESQLNERFDAIDMFFDGLEELDDRNDGQSNELLAELTQSINLPLKLPKDHKQILANDPESLREDIRDQVQILLLTQTINRLMGAVQRRLEENVEILNNQLQFDNWDILADQVLNIVENIFNKRVERYLGQNGQITRELDQALSKTNGQINQQDLYHLFLLYPRGEQAAFDKKTHRRIRQWTTRMTLVYSTAHFLENREPDEVAADILDHLEKAQEFLGMLWGNAEFNRLATADLSSLDSSTKKIQNILGEESFTKFEKYPLQALPDEQRRLVIQELGRRSLTEIYRQLLLSVMTELWVDYLTQMEALRISIGLEAYAHRDPLVQYKSKASGLFQDFLSNLRLGVITRMFVYHPRDISSIQASIRVDAESESEAYEAGVLERTTETEEDQIEPETTNTMVEESSSNGKGDALQKSERRGKKRRRHHR